MTRTHARRLRLPTPMPRRLLTITLTLAVVLLTVAAVRGVNGDTKLTAHFDNSTGIYAGDEVRVLGVPVGRIDKVTPDRSGVTVAFHVDHGVKVPADAGAVIVAPSLVSGRYLQLAPQYHGGAVMQSGASIPQSRTAVPVEWDQIKGELNDLSVALGPRGANKDGALNNLVTTGDRVLSGQGETINQTLHDLSEAVTTLNSGSGDVFSTVRNLEVFVKALASSNDQIRSLDTNLGTISTVLADDRGSLRQLLTSLSVAVAKVDTFVKTNGNQLTTTVNGLADVTKVVARNQADLAQVLHVGPNALRNFINIYYKKDNVLDAGFVFSNLSNAAELICGSIATVTSVPTGQAAKTCYQYVGPLLAVFVGDPSTGGGVLTGLLQSLGVKLP